MQEIGLLKLIGEYGSGAAAVVSLLGAACVLWLSSKFARRGEFEDLKDRVAEKKDVEELKARVAAGEDLSRNILAALSSIDARLTSMDRNMGDRLRDLSEKTAWRFESLEKRAGILPRGHLNRERDH